MIKIFRRPSRSASAPVGISNSALPIHILIKMAMASVGLRCRTSRLYNSHIGSMKVRSDRKLENITSRALRVAAVLRFSCTDVS